MTVVDASPVSETHRRIRRKRTAGLLVAALVVLAAAVAWWLVPPGAPSPPPASLGIVQDRALPASVLNAPLVDESGAAMTLASLSGSNVVLVPFLTSCQEECPLTTAALISMRRSVAAAGLSGQVSFVEVTVDPGRDMPSRLAAYARLTGADWPMVTGSPSTLAAIWKYFGVYYQVVPEDSPPGIDWQTGKPYTYDVNHSDGFILLGSNLHERFATTQPFDLTGRHLPKALAALLDGAGKTDLAHPPTDSWTIAQGDGALGWLLGRSLPVEP